MQYDDVQIGAFDLSRVVRITLSLNNYLLHINKVLCKPYSCVFPFNMAKIMNTKKLDVKFSTSKFHRNLIM